MAESSLLDTGPARSEGPAQSDLDKCVHCGLCLNACPTYRELRVEMDSPRGRIYQMNQVASGAPITPDYVKHLDLCLACRGCETACPSGVPYGRIIEAARAQIESRKKPTLWTRALKTMFFQKLLPSPAALQAAGAGLYLYQISGLQRFARATGALKPFGNVSKLEALSPKAEVPFFFSKIGKTFPAVGERRYRVAFLAGCIANIAFARLNEATVRVLQRNGCEVVIPGGQTCCGALHVHAGLRKQSEALARKNVNAIRADDFDAIVTNAAGCGSTLKEYDELLEHDLAYHDQTAKFVHRVKDILEFIDSVGVNPTMAPINGVATYQDSCHLAHGQKIKDAPRRLLKTIPGLIYREMPMADLCCGSAGIYNVVHNEMALEILRHKMEHVAATNASLIATANPGCMLQLAAGVRLFGQGQRVAHVIEVLDEAYEKCSTNSSTKRA